MKERAFVAADVKKKKNQTNISHRLKETRQFTVKTGHTPRECGSLIHTLHVEMAAASEYQRHYNVKDEVKDGVYFFLYTAKNDCIFVLLQIR